MAPLDQETPLPLALVDLAPGLAKSAVKDLETSADHKDPSILAPDPKPASAAESPRYRTYKRRWVGLFGLFLVNLVNAMNAQWFAAIVEQSATLLETTVTKINWFANVCNLTSLVSYTLVPSLCRRYSVRTLAIGAAALNIVGAWIRYGGIRASDPSVQWGIVLFGQMINGFATPLSLALGTKYSEAWFPLRERTTATMLLTISNPFGMALASVIAPLIAVEATDVALSVLVMSCVNFLHLVAFVVPSTPAIPPTYAASLLPPSFSDGVRLFLGDNVKLPCLSPPTDDGGRHRAKMTPRERIDLWVIFAEYTILVASLTSLQVEIASVFMPYGYSSSASGNIAGGMILAGLVGAGTTAPLLDHYFKRHLALAAKALIPVVAAMNLSLIWVIKPDNDIAVVAVFVVMGFCSFSLLAIGLELGAEITRQPEASSSAFYWLSTLWTFAMVNILDSVRAGDDASPPANMDRGIIVEVVFTVFAAVLIFFLEGDQRRTREDRERLEKEVQSAATTTTSSTVELPTLSA